MKNTTQALKVITLALILSFGISYVYAWTAPTVTPPNGNVSAPINTSATFQYKEGTLGIGGLIRGYANAIFDGSVGIGTTTPNAALTVVGMYRGTSNIRSEGEVFGVVPGSGVGAELGVGGAGVFAYLQGFNRTTPGYAPLHLYGSYMSLQPGGGNVGIGTTTPNALLSLYNNYNGGAIAPIHVQSSGKESGISFGKSVNGDQLFSIKIGSGSTNRSDFTVVDETAGASDRLTIQSGTGNVGIGTTNVTSWAKLEVNGNVSLTGDDGSGHSLITSEVGGKPLMLKSRAGDYPDLVVGTNGNVGIGTSVPKSKLDVQSTFSVTQANGINTRRYGLVNFVGYGAIGSEWAQKIYTIRTPDTATSGEMYKYDVTGFSYGIGRPISLTYVGYLFGGAPTVITNGYSMDNAGVGINTWQDIGYDGHLYLHFGPISQYYNTFTLDYQSGATGEPVEHIPAGYSVTLSN